MYALEVIVGTDIQARRARLGGGARGPAPHAGGAPLTPLRVAARPRAAQVFENESDKAAVHKNPLAHYKPNIHVRGAAAPRQRRGSCASRTR